MIMSSSDQSWRWGFCTGPYDYALKHFLFLLLLLPPSLFLFPLLFLLLILLLPELMSSCQSYCQVLWPWEYLLSITGLQFAVLNIAGTSPLPMCSVHLGNLLCHLHLYHPKHSIAAKFILHSFCFLGDRFYSQT